MSTDNTRFANAAQRQTENQAHDLIQDFLRRTAKGQKLCAIQAMNLLADCYGLRYDWHEFSIVLDKMERYEMATRDYSERGMAYYVID